MEEPIIISDSDSDVTPPAPRSRDPRLRPGSRYRPPNSSPVDLRVGPNSDHTHGPDEASSSPEAEWRYSPLHQASPRYAPPQDWTNHPSGDNGRVEDVDESSDEEMREGRAEGQEDARSDREQPSDDEDDGPDWENASDDMEGAAHYVYAYEDRYGFRQNHYVQLMRLRMTTYIIETPFMPTPDPIVEFPPSPTRPAIGPPEEMVVDHEPAAPTDPEENIPEPYRDAGDIADPHAEPDTRPPPLVCESPTNEDGGCRPPASQNNSNDELASGKAMHWSSASSESEDDDDEAPRFRRRSRASRESPHTPTTPAATPMDLDISPGTLRHVLEEVPEDLGELVLEYFATLPQADGASPNALPLRAPWTTPSPTRPSPSPTPPRRPPTNATPSTAPTSMSPTAHCTSNAAEGDEGMAPANGRVPAPPRWSVNTPDGMLTQGVIDQVVARRAAHITRRTRLRICTEDGVYSATMKPDDTVIIIFPPPPK
ncbi:hypothetical protein KR084_009777 [Drosophila pseudotakahashii]|nr:hypothetical protein KR084_009777 [Drosophila pseudotakahashii]